MGCWATEFSSAVAEIIWAGHEVSELLLDGVHVKDGVHGDLLHVELWESQGFYGFACDFVVLDDGLEDGKITSGELDDVLNNLTDGSLDVLKFWAANSLNDSVKEYGEILRLKYRVEVSAVHDVPSTDGRVEVSSAVPTGVVVALTYLKRVVGFDEFSDVEERVESDSLKSGLVGE